MEIFSWIFFGPSKLVALWPYAGVAIAGALIGIQAWLHIRGRKVFDRRFFREAPVFAGILWLIFNAFELQMAAIAAQAAIGGGGLMRLDLIVLVPILYVLSAAAILSISRQIGGPVAGDDPGGKG